MPPSTSDRTMYTPAGSARFRRMPRLLTALASTARKLRALLCDATMAGQLPTKAESSQNNPPEKSAQTSVDSPVAKEKSPQWIQRRSLYKTASSGFCSARGPSRAAWLPALLCLPVDRPPHRLGRRLPLLLSSALPQQFPVQTAQLTKTIPAVLQRRPAAASATATQTHPEGPTDATPIVVKRAPPADQTAHSRASNRAQPCICP